MQQKTIATPLQSGAIKRDIDVIACRFAKDEVTRQDFRQEMRCHLLTLPPGKGRTFYFRSLARQAYTYWAHKVLDAPSGPCGRPIVERQTVAIGGLRELDHVLRRRAA